MCTPWLHTAIGSVSDCSCSGRKFESVEDGGGGWGYDRRNRFMIDPHESYVAELRFELATPGSAVPGSAI